ncbi:MAG: septal ring lytic transglycosylase RlpA family protein [Candidatus Paceibacterota bacterium]
MRTEPTDIEVERFRKWKDQRDAMAATPEGVVANPQAGAGDQTNQLPLGDKPFVSIPPAYESPTQPAPQPDWLRTTGEVMGAIVGAPIKFALALPGAVVSSINNAYNLWAHVAAGGKFKDPETGRELTYTQAMDPKEASETLRTSIGMANFDLATIPFGGGAGGAKTGLTSSPKFYSPLERALETGQIGKLFIPDNPKATGMLSTLKYATDKNLINMEELNYTGLLQKLKSLGDQRVSRDEMLQLVRSKSLKETGEPSVLGPIDPKLQAARDRLERIATRTTNELDELYKKAPDRERYEIWQPDITRLQNRRMAVANAMEKLEKRSAGGKYGPENYSSFNLPGHIPGTYQERLFHFTPEGGLRYVEPHDWPGNVADNAFMFTRGHDRKLPNGELAKHLDETQSSLHQKAMEEGYATPIGKDELPTGWTISKEPPNIPGRPDLNNREYYILRDEEGAKINGAYDRDSLVNYAQGYLGQRSNIPPAPFKDLKWAKLGLKEWVDTAVREGKDSVTWSTGRIVADRYNKLVNSFNWTKDLKTGKYTLHFETPNGRTFDQGYVNMKQLQDNAGKNVARIVEEQEKIATAASKNKPKDSESYSLEDRAGGAYYEKADDRYKIFDDMGELTDIVRYREDASALVAKMRSENWPGTGRAISGDGATGDFLVGGKFFEKVYDEYMVREAEREYGVRPVKIKTTIADPNAAPTYQQLRDARGNLVDAYEKARGEQVEVWYLPLSPDLKQSITIKGQRIAQGSLTTTQALKALAQRDEKPKLDESATHDSHPQGAKASWYGKQFHGKPMAGNPKKPFDMNKMTAAHRTLPLGTKIKVTDKHTNKSVVVEVTDRGPYKYPNRVLDLSKAAADKLGITKKGVANIKIDIIKEAKKNPPHITVKDASSK